MYSFLFFFFFVSWLYIVVLLKYSYLAMDYSRSFSKHGFYNSTDPLICHSWSHQTWKIQKIQKLS